MSIAQRNRPEKELLVVRELNHQRHIESVLKPFGEDEGNQVSDVQSIRRWSSSGVQEERLALLVAIENRSQISVGEKETSSE
jgi:hypothetical protein